MALSQHQALYYAHLAALQLHQKILDDRRKEEKWRENEKELARHKEALEKKRSHLLKHAGRHAEGIRQGARLRQAHENEKAKAGLLLSALRKAAGK